MKSISIKNAKPIEYLDIPLPEDGGFVVLTGTHGTGKTTALKAVETLVNGEGTIEKRDGTLESRVEGLGMTISVKKKQTRSGESCLAVTNIAGRFDISDIIDPHIKDPIAADAYRIKRLIQLAGVKPNIELFHKLLGGPTEFSSVVGEQEADDLVTLAKRVKKAIETAAREQESKADQARGAAEAHNTAAISYDDVIGPERDLTALNLELEEAIRDEAKVKADHESGTAAKKRAEEALEMLADAKTAYTGLSVEAAEAEVNKKNRIYNEALDVLAAAKKAVEDADAECKLAWAAHKEAENHEKNMAAWKRSIEDAANVNVPSEAEVDAAAKDVLHCREQIELAIAKRAAREHLDHAKQQEAIAKTAQVNGERYRKAAGEVDSVLSEAVGTVNCPLRVKDERLVLTTDRGEEYFADLSDGERCSLVLDIAIPLVPDDLPLILSQAAWGELAPKTRKDLNAKLKEERVVCVTAEVTDDDKLAATVFDDKKKPLVIMDASVAADMALYRDNE